MSGLLKVVRNDFEKFVERAESIDGLKQTFFKKNIYPIYQKAQIERWKTGGLSEGFGWESLDEKYLERKRRLKATKGTRYPGGDKILVLSGDLLKSLTIVGEKWSRVVVSKEGLSVSTGAPYAQYVDKERTFSKWGKSTRDEIKGELKRFLSNFIKGKA